MEFRDVAFSVFKKMYILDKNRLQRPGQGRLSPVGTEPNHFTPAPTITLKAGFSMGIIIFKTPGA
jgi:hypothetical protein